jgi:hypothetical protein
MQPNQLMGKNWNQHTNNDQKDLIEAKKKKLAKLVVFHSTTKLVISQ